MQRLNSGSDLQMLESVHQANFSSTITIKTTITIVLLYSNSAVNYSFRGYCCELVNVNYLIAFYNFGAAQLPWEICGQEPGRIVFTMKHILKKLNRDISLIFAMMRWAINYNMEQLDSHGADVATWDLLCCSFDQILFSWTFCKKEICKA